jgi:phosphatidylglycerophosphate synthase
MDLYRLKPASARLVQPLEDRLVAAGVSPDAISASAIVLAAAGGACLALSDRVPWLLLIVPIVAAARLIANILDGSVARRIGVARPIGEIWNELGDRVADVLFIGGLALIPSVDPRLALGAVIAALVASYAGLATRAAGGHRLYVGVMAKPGRMIVLAIAAPAAFITGDGRLLAAAAVVILVGSLVTLGQRLLVAHRELGRAG